MGDEWIMEQTLLEVAKQLDGKPPDATYSLPVSRGTALMLAKAVKLLGVIRMVTKS